MAYDETPRKPIEVRDGRKDGYYSHDQCIENGGNSAKEGFRTDVKAEGVGYLCVDDLDRIRRKNLKHRTR